MVLENKMILTFTACSENESFARNAVACFALKLNPSLSEISDIKTAVSEAVTNSIVHGYPENDGEITIEAKIICNELHIKILDKGVGIENLEQALEPFFTTKADEERSGMGFTIMESFMDNLKVRSKPGVGTTITMRKKISMRLGGLARDKFC